MQSKPLLFWFGSLGHFHTQQDASEVAVWLKEAHCRAQCCGKTTKYY